MINKGVPDALKFTPILTNEGLGELNTKIISTRLTKAYPSSIEKIPYEILCFNTKKCHDNS